MVATAFELSLFALYSTRLLMQYQLAQLRHRTPRFCQVRYSEKLKRSLEMNLPEMPLKINECAAMLIKHNRVFNKLIDFVCIHPELPKERKIRNRRGAA